MAGGLGGMFGPHRSKDEESARALEVWRINAENDRFEKFTKLHEINEKSKFIHLGSPEWVNYKIALWDRKNIRDKDIEYISRHSLNLNILRICNLEYITKLATGIFSGSPLLFLRLEVLHISNCPNLENFRIVAPLLKKLEIFDNPLLTSISARVPFSTNILVKTSLPKIDIDRGLEDSDLMLIGRAHVDILDLSYCEKITDEGLKHLKSANIRKLVLRGCPKITQHGSSHLEDFNNLKELTLSEGSEKNSIPIIFLEKLTHIDLSDNAGFLDLPLVCLRHEYISLSISNCAKLTDSSLTFLKDMVNLKELRMNNNQGLTNVGLDHLKHLQLEKLSIAKCKWLTNAGLKVLEQIKSLKILNVKGCPQVTLQGIQLLSQAILGIKILHD